LLINVGINAITALTGIKNGQLLDRESTVGLLKKAVEVTMENMIHHIKAVVRGCKGPLVVEDMPFMSYNISIQEAIRNAGRLMKEGGCDVVKLEGGVDFSATVKAIVKAGIPVQGHIGLTPQTASALGGFKMQGRDANAAMGIIEDAKALEAAGVFSMILEAVPAPLGQLKKRINTQ
jgi:3-methyl-2-oxobutanoate hydroxymethyltransferase